MPTIFILLNKLAYFFRIFTKIKEDYIRNIFAIQKVYVLLRAFSWQPQPRGVKNIKIKNKIKQKQ